MVILTSLPPPTEGIRHKQTSTQAHVKGRTNRCLGTGDLYVAESRLSWTSAEGHGFSLEYPAISLHAISKDLTAFPHECIYVMVDGNLDEEAAGSDNSSSSSDSNPITEFRFVPEDKGSLEAIYGAMCECQALHPDEEESLSDYDDDYYDGEDGAEQLTAAGAAQLERLDGLLRGADDDDDPGDDERRIGRAAVTNGRSNDDGMETDEPTEAGQFEDVDM